MIPQALSLVTLRSGPGRDSQDTWDNLTGSMKRRVAAAHIAALRSRAFAPAGIKRQGTLKMHAIPATRVLLPQYRPG